MRNVLNRPHNLGESFAPAVNRILPAVRRQCVGLSIQIKLRATDPVRDPADHGGGSAKALEVLQAVRGEQDVGEAPIPIGRVKRLDDRAIADDLGAHAFGIPQRDPLHLGAILGFSEIRLLDPPLPTSPRRFLRRGHLRNKLHNIALIAAWRFGAVSPEKIHEIYYQHRSEGET